MLFEHAITISNRQDITKFMKKIIDLDLNTNYYLRKPSSGWVLAGLSNLQLIVFELKDFAIGNPPDDIPDYIRNSKSIYTLSHQKRNSKKFNDNKCFFRCLALHITKNIHGLESLSNRLLAKAENYMDTTLKQGINISLIPKMELCFRKAINVYALNQNNSADIINLSRLPYISGRNIQD